MPEEGGIPTAQCLKVLIVDDDTVLAESLSDILRYEGYMVDIADTGESGKVLVETNAYDFALLDIRLPGLNGVELFKFIRQKQPTTTVVLATGYRVPELVAEGKEHSVDGVATKPISIEGLLTILHKLASGMRVLLIDDDEEFVSTTAEILTREGVLVDVAYDGVGGISLAIRGVYDLVLVDLRLPDAPGWEIAKQIRQGRPGVEIVAVTGYAEEIGKRREKSPLRVVGKTAFPGALIGLLKQVRRDFIRQALGNFI